MITLTNQVGPTAVPIDTQLLGELQTMELVGNRRDKTPVYTMETSGQIKAVTSGGNFSVTMLYEDRKD